MSEGFSSDLPEGISSDLSEGINLGLSEEPNSEMSKGTSSESTSSEKPYLFDIQCRSLRVIGNAFEVNAKRRWTERYTGLFHFGTLFLVASAQVPMLAFTIHHKNNLPLATAGLSIIFTNLLSLVKISTFFFHKKEFVRLIGEFTTMFDKMKEPYAKHVLATANDFASRLVRFYCYSAYGTGVYLMVAPLPKMAWASLMGHPVAVELPMKMKFPFEFDTPPRYGIIYVYTAFVTVVVIVYSTAVDGIFLGFTINLRGHFQALQNFVRSNSFIAADSRVRRDVADLVQYHQMLLALSERVSHIFKPIIVGQFLVTSLQVCMIVYQLVINMDSIMYLFIYGSFLVSILLQLFIYCYGGEIIRHESLMVDIAVQTSQWYNLAPRYQRIMILMILRSQRAVIIKALFYEASLANFIMILKAAMSYITLIQSIE